MFHYYLNAECDNTSDETPEKLDAEYISTDSFEEAEAWANSLKAPWYVEAVEISDDDGNEFMRNMAPDDWRSFRDVCEEIYADLEHADEMDEYGDWQ